MTFSGITTALTQCAKSMNGLVTQMGTQLQTQFGPAINSVKDSIDVLKSGQDVVSTVLHDVTGQEVTIRHIQKGAKDFDEKWDAFAKEVNDKFNTAPTASQTNIMETFAKSHFGDDVYKLGSAVKNELPNVLDGIADYKEVIDSVSSSAKTAEEAAIKIQKGVDKMVKATEKVAGSLNNAIEICTGNGIPVLDSLSKLGGSAATTNLNKTLELGVAGASLATATNQLKEAVKNGDFRSITDAMAKSANSVNDLLTQLNKTIPGFPNQQIPVQITNSIKRLQNGQAVYDAAGSMLTALVVDASSPITPQMLATLTSHFNTNWDTFSDKINALFDVSPAQGQTAVLETLTKNVFGQNVFNAAGAIKRQLPGVLDGVAGVQDAIKQFGGSYRDPIEAATKIRNGVEKMVQSIEKIGQSLNNMIIRYQGGGKGYPLLETMGKLGDTKGIKALDNVLRVVGGAAAIAGNAGAVAQAIKNKDILGAISAVKKTIDDVKKLTKKGEYNIKDNQSNKKNDSVDSSNNTQSKQTNQVSAAQTDSYVCSGATMKCSMGTSQAKLIVLPSRTVYLTGQPMANISDHLSMVNLSPFGRCRSMGFPATASATAANYGSLTPMPCVHNTPFPWMSGKNDYIVKGDPALLKSSTCSCMWGGTICIVNDGQTPTGSVDLSRVDSSIFLKNQPNKKKKTVPTLHLPSKEKKRYEERKQKHCKRILDTIEEKRTNKVYLFWTNGGGSYASELREDILRSHPDKEIVIQKLEETERGKTMERRVNKIMSLLIGENVEEMTWEERSKVFKYLKDSEDTKKHIDKIEAYQRFKSGKYAEEAAQSSTNDNAALFLVAGTRRTNEGSIKIHNDSVWREKERQVLKQYGQGIDGVLLNGDL